MYGCLTDDQRRSSVPPSLSPRPALHDHPPRSLAPHRRHLQARLASHFAQLVQCPAPAAHVSWKNPRLPFGVLISHNAPSLVASIGRIARYTSSLTRDASSTSNSRTAENPRIVASVPGSPTMRDPFGSASEISLSPSPVGRIFSWRTN